MSKRIEAKITCPGCSKQFDYTLYRSIWGEYPENRELVMLDKINVATCPDCQKSTKLIFPFIYTNAKMQFAVWWEPEYDTQIDDDSKGYARMMGNGNYLAAAPRIKDWDEFKDTILRFESGELKGRPGEVSKELNKEMEGFLKHLQEKNQAKKKQWLSRHICVNIYNECCYIIYFIKNILLMDKVIKITLAVLFFICLADMPYGYYQLVRFAALLGFSLLAYRANSNMDKTGMVIYICLAILFQPLVKISLGRQLWNIVDVIAGIALLASLFIKSKSIQSKP